MTAVVRNNYWRLSLVFFVSLLIASAWLIFPYLIQGKQLLGSVGDTARLTKAGNVSMYLTRYLVDHQDLELTATFATDEFFQYVDQATTIGNLRCMSVTRYSRPRIRSGPISQNITALQFTAFRSGRSPGLLLI